MMTADELRIARQQLGLNIKQMAMELQTPYRTYQDWELGTTRIPGVTQVAVKALLVRPDCVLCDKKTGEG